MSNSMNRRDVLKYAGVAAAGLLASPLVRWAGAQGEKTKKVLFFTRSQGFEHSAITRPRNDPQALSFAEKWLVDFGKQHNFEVTCSKDGGLFTEEGLAPFDVIMFYTTGYLDRPLDARSMSHGDINNHPFPHGGKETFLRLIAEGKKGFLGVHSSTDTFHSRQGQVDPYIDMLGGEFVIHGKQQNAKIEAVDKNWAPIPNLETFTKLEEWYILKNLAPDMHVLLVQDTKSMDEQRYKDLAPYPETWARHYKQGKVFYTSMGHREDVWQSPEFSRVLLGGLNWVAGNVEAEIKPNIHEVTPGAMIRPTGAA